MQSKARMVGKIWGSSKIIDITDSESPAVEEWFEEWFDHDNKSKQDQLFQSLTSSEAEIRKWMAYCGGPHLDNDEVRMCRYVLATAPSGVDESNYNNELLFMTTCISLTRKELLSLKPNEWLSEQVIGAAAMLLNYGQRGTKKNGMFHVEFKSKRTHWYLPTIACKMPTSWDIEKRKKALLEWFGPNIRDCERMYIPMNRDNVHWYLLVVSFIDKKVYVVDTMRPKDFETRAHDECNRVLDDIQQLLENLEKSYFEDNKIKISQWPKVHPAHMPYQPELRDGSSCGLYVIYFMMDPSQLPRVEHRNTVSVLDFSARRAECNI